MSTPSVSVRKHIRRIPDPPSEPTSTLVLTSNTSQFIDIRIRTSTDQHGALKELANNDGPMSCLEWAFAGPSTSTRPSDPKMPFHTVWVHWIDSESSDPAVDEGDMYPQPNGDVLEKGTTVNPATGGLLEYEELWSDLDIRTIGVEAKRVCIVLKAEAENQVNKGMVIRIGGWCQGILQSGEDITVERWQWVNQTESGANNGSMTHARQEDTSAKDEKEGNWERVVRLGNHNLPCGVTFEPDLLGDNAKVDFGNLEWKVVENYRW